MTFPALRRIRVSEHVHAFVHTPSGWCVGNASAVARDRRAVVVDGFATEEMNRRLQVHLAAVADEIPYVVNTHHHGDHVYGNAFFPRTAKIVAHTETVAPMRATGKLLTSLWPEIDWGDFELRLPDVAFTGSMRIDLDGLEVRLVDVSPAHTEGDVVAWIPEDEVLIAGDVAFSDSTPFALMGSIRGWLAALERLRTLEPAIVVPGHGPVGGPEILRRNADYLDWIWTVAGESIRAGHTVKEAVNRTGVPAPFRTWGERERLAPNLEVAYWEHGAAPRPDHFGAFDRMCAFHGGPLRSPAIVPREPKHAREHRHGRPRRG